MLIRMGAAIVVSMLVTPAQFAAQVSHTLDRSAVNPEMTQKTGGTSDKKGPQATADKAQKPKKVKKPKSDAPAPDESVDPDAVDTGDGGLRLEWKQHPRIQLGSIFRLEFEVSCRRTREPRTPLRRVFGARERPCRAHAPGSSIGTGSGSRAICSRRSNMKWNVS